MKGTDSVLLQNVGSTSNQDLIMSYIRDTKAAKSLHQAEVSCLSQVVKDKNAEIADLKASLNLQEQIIERHNIEFKKFRSLFSSLKSKSENGKISSDVMHGPEIMALTKEINRLDSLYQQELTAKKKYEARSVAMTTQIIERQKKIFKLEALLLESDNKRLLLESQLYSDRATSKKSGFQFNFQGMLSKLKDRLELVHRRLQAS